MRQKNKNATWDKRCRTSLIQQMLHLLVGPRYPGKTSVCLSFFLILFLSNLSDFPFYPSFSHENSVLQVSLQKLQWLFLFFISNTAFKKIVHSLQHIMQLFFLSIPVFLLLWTQSGFFPQSKIQTIDIQNTFPLQAQWKKQTNKKNNSADLLLEKWDFKISILSSPATQVKIKVFIFSFCFEKNLAKKKNRKRIQTEFNNNPPLLIYNLSFYFHSFVASNKLNRLFSPVKCLWINFFQLSNKLVPQNFQIWRNTWKKLHRKNKIITETKMIFIWALNQYNLSDVWSGQPSVTSWRFCFLMKGGL
jgi:hypothetical protein